MLTCSKTHTNRRRYSPAAMTEVEAAAAAYLRARDQVRRSACWGSCWSCGAPASASVLSCRCGAPSPIDAEYEAILAAVKRANHLREYRAARFSAMAAIGVAARWSWFRTFQPANASQTAAVEAARAFNGSPWSLVLSGPPGVGKTHLGLAIWNRISRRTCLGTWLTEPVAERQWRAAMDNQFLPRADRDPDQPSPDDLVDQWSSVPWLFLDDLGVVPSTRAAWVAAMGEVVHQRERQHRPTVISTNLTSRDISDRYGPRFVSRLLSGKCLRVEGDDRRLGK